MRTPFDTRAAGWLAGWIDGRAVEMRRELQDHLRNESRRIALATKRARGLRIYAAWCRASRREPGGLTYLLTATQPR